MTNSKTRVGIIGVGRMSDYVAAVLAELDNVEVVKESTIITLDSVPDMSPFVIYAEPKNKPYHEQHSRRGKKKRWKR